MQKNNWYFIAVTSISLAITSTFASPLTHQSQERNHFWLRCQQQAETIYQETRKENKSPSVAFKSDNLLFDPPPKKYYATYWSERLKKLIYAYTGYLYYIDNQMGLQKSYYLTNFPNPPKNPQHKPFYKCITCCAWKINSAPHAQKTMQGVCAWRADDPTPRPLVGIIEDRSTLQGHYCFDRMAPALATGQLSHGKRLNSEKNNHFPYLNNNE